MDCLQNFIGLSSSCSVVSTSGLYIEDLGGVSLKSIAAVADGKYANAQAAVDRMMYVFGAKLLDRLNLLLGDVYVGESVESLISKNFGDDTIAYETGTPGLRIKKTPTALSQLFVQRFYFRSATAVIDLPVVITDGYNEVIEYVTADADQEVMVDISYSTDQNTINITYTSDAGPTNVGVEPYTGNIWPYHRWYHSCGSCGQEGSLHHLIIKGLDFAGEEKNVYYGIRVDVQLRCDKSKMICLIRDNHKTMFLYGLGVELASDAVGSDRLNIKAINGRDWWAAMGVEWRNELEVLWESSRLGIQKYLMGAERACFDCRGYESKYSPP